MPSPANGFLLTSGEFASFACIMVMSWARRFSRSDGKSMCEANESASLSTIAERIWYMAMYGLA
ncbi:hypothetical protein BPA30113_07315 [Burkholderia paludis]|uniref:Uncharacterized protein n=1 Tax=Burkholderia paludis TaxID=1506587 RepID=A0A6P2SCU1_9BURK|nr:hypothetical protein LMG30113_07142 [Burkholderia paludis]VWC46095.1 hypothetical protein BPA30113_07315 [Burkholderia paludis]